MRWSTGVSFLAGLFFLLSIGIGRTQNSEEFYKMLDDMYQHSVQQISPTDLNAKISDSKYIILDTRELNEFEVSHLPGAIFVGFDNFSLQNIASISKEHIIVMYCSVGYRSERIGELLLKNGYSNVLNLRGGIFEWAALQYKLVDSEKNVVKKVHPYNKRWSKWVRNCEIAYE
jgi:rhodanese-related sulfurtransferase